MTWNFKCSPKESHFDFKVFNSLSELDIKNWENVLKSNNIFLSVSYLRSLEDSSIQDINFKYVLFYKDNQPVGIAYFQILDIGKIKPENDSRLEKISAKIKSTFLNVLNLKILICGNIFTTGENGFYFSDSISEEDKFDNLSNILFQIRVAENENNTPSVVLLKEFWPSTTSNSNKLLEYDFRPFNIDVNMVLKLQEDWKSIDDYLASMVTKFRTKAKSCFKKSKEIETRRLDIEYINSNLNRIEELYYNVVDNADFQISKLTNTTFSMFSENLNENFIITGYFLKDKLVGFKTGFINDKILEAGYIGLDYEFNYEYAVYQKMLYDYVEIAILNNLTELRFGRTAEEIKSCLGAEPVNMTLYVRHRNSLSNKVIKPVITSISPSEFSIRKPFKKGMA